jgi:hypothetical protein
VTRDLRLLLLAVPGIFLWSAVSAWSAPSAPDVDFSHVEHLTREPDKSCLDCHDISKKTGAAPSWNRTACTRCHDAAVPGYMPRARGPLLGVAFSHGQHLAKVDCVACHKRTNDDAPFTRPGKRACFSCHAKSSGDVPQEVACTSCHGQNQRAVKPPSHDSLWTRRHGVHADPFHAFDHGQACTLCHKENTCVSCHQTQKPRDHTALWRVRSHGSAAAWDSTRCKTCHETNQCISCHQSEAPRNHRGAWQATHGLVARSRGDASCLTCHRPASCVSCHAGGSP